MSDTDGTFFIQQICDVLRHARSDSTLDELVTKVNAAVSRNAFNHKDDELAQTSEAVHTLCSNVKLFNKHNDVDDGGMFFRPR